MADLTRLLNAVQTGDRVAAAELLPLVYDELRRLAAAKMADEQPGHTLDGTALVHEAYLRLVGPADRDLWDNRNHFFAAAAEAMRRILVESARRKRALKHGGSGNRIDFDTVELPARGDRDDLLALDAALTRLAETDPEAARLVELRHFAGMTIPESASVLGVSPRTADRLWAFARAWLHRELTGDDS